MIHVGFVYEDVCRQKMWELNAEGKLPFLFDRVGRWRGGRNVEIDIVAVDTSDQSKILFGECKYRQKSPMTLSEFNLLRSKASYVLRGNGRRQEYFILFCIGGYTDELQALAANDPSVILA